MTLAPWPNPVDYAIPVFVLSILAEMLYGRLTGRVSHEPRDSLTSLTMGLGSTVAGALFAAAIFTVGAFVWQHFRLLDIPRTWWALVIAFVLDDLRYYWFHRLSHRVRWFWASHVIHHSSQHYNLTTALRQTWTGFFSATWVFKLPLFLIGFDPVLIAFVGGLNLIYQFWIHTEAIDRLPRWVEAFFNTPSHHRVHHATNPDYLDANYAGTLIVWDRMFGTFVPERREEPCRYGIVHNLASFNPLIVAFHEWIGLIRDLVSARSWRDRRGYAFGPPGWSPDGSRLTTDTLKARWAQHRRALSGPRKAPVADGTASPTSRQPEAAE
ncbi:sterol desaturase/sphingolipid hydroxylase (fatty acid hydroxylase superfamily) [Rhodothalassium salexigens DSM 2132]|uniref:Sterol desaturase/sphingolipid hydroxylase (Fatty acid hydroxylase superfamily) n=1 Tax=Rhodothalassium salexigens DSM 2132 TaxID=1188247 RepID=A0A4V2SP62_RHOSA|nr:sterol desaturase family protein [Rhodothalassium salexigens]MBB4211848.1 sterol desaturase/sphingolipid hydroxylase (fatty acid hydroxylase superfamily) [Rhodothalassium salexigens DSM 2132]MBK1638855.1 C-5 sterol desaturase [Rhodothalassium salexigens DSM 2132]TCP33856.1 sterol desaturase/sphingolipid hydroxylase (fatty acid hydroxylase superfamily) [Rhodothalassium salexigens DSM 2132]